MAASPGLKVYLGSEYRAAFKYAEDAASFVAFLGDGATIRDGHEARYTVWSEGKEAFPASESFDDVAALVAERRGKMFAR